MAYTSTRYLVIRDAVFDSLRADAALAADVRGWAKDPESFASLAATQFPAIAVLFPQEIGEQQARWASAGHDHTYEFEVMVSAETLDSGGAQDKSIAYMERAEDVLRANPTLGGMARSVQCRVSRRVSEKRQKTWRSTVALLVTVEKRV